MAVVQYKCLNCGGPLKFDPATGKHTCEYCRSVFVSEELKEPESESAADSAKATAQMKPESTVNAEEAGKVYTCPSCGATIMTDDTTAATFCYYCHNPVVLSGRLEGSLRPDFVVPFRIDRKKALSIFESWIQKKKYVPDAFYSKEQIEKFTGVYFPYLLYSCNLDGKIEADVTKTEIRTEGDFEVTDRGLYHIVRDGNMEIRYVLRNALKKANSVLAECVQPFELDAENLKPFQMSYLSGFFAEKRDIEKEELTDSMRQEVREHAVSSLQDSVSEYDDVRITDDHIRLVNEKWHYALFPVWTMTYKHGGKLYYFSVNGQTGKTVGELPVDNGKLLRTFLLIFIPFMLVLLAVFYFIF